MSSLLTNEQLKSIPELYASTILKDPICRFKIISSRFKLDLVHNRDKQGRQ